ncbi:hypothetical protein MTR67_048887 [Solanum verrucosum]|uniref:Uncharacterized protein n=1 Tax=Solanum verrucosum TaxID=315347 RepID=A0AAF0ZWY4_SOLVR|nr:hypothetical protein MTR67_048887 [Solanum verrucosum]
MLLTDHEIVTITTNNRPPPDTKQAGNNNFRRCSGEELIAPMNWSSTSFKPPQLASGEPIPFPLSHLRFCLALDHFEAASSEFNGFTHQRTKRRNRSPGPSMVVFRICNLVKEKGFQMN